MVEYIGRINVSKDTMLFIIMRTKHREYNYSLNPGVIETLEKLFSKENKEIAKRYGRIEDLTKGLLYT